MAGLPDVVTKPPVFTRPGPELDIETRYAQNLTGSWTGGEAMMSEQWTIDSIAHALPHPVTRQKFLAEINLSPVDKLPDVISRWVQFVEQWQAGRDSAEKLRDHFKEHGHLPAAYEATLIDMTDRILEDAERIRRGAA